MIWLQIQMQHDETNRLIWYTQGFVQKIRKINIYRSEIDIDLIWLQIWIEGDDTNRLICHTWGFEWNSKKSIFIDQYWSDRSVQGRFITPAHAQPSLQISAQSVQNSRCPVRRTTTTTTRNRRTHTIALTPCEQGFKNWSDKLFKYNAGLYENLRAKRG